jgi:hypothetical protein
VEKVYRELVLYDGVIELPIAVGSYEEEEAVVGSLPARGEVGLCGVLYGRRGELLSLCRARALM